MYDIFTHIWVKISTTFYLDGTQRSLAMPEVVGHLKGLASQLIHRMPEIIDLIEKGTISDYLPIDKIHLMNLVFVNNEFASLLSFSWF